MKLFKLLSSFIGIFVILLISFYTLSPTVEALDLNNLPEHGIIAEYFNNSNLEGEPAVTRIEENIDNSWGYSAPADGIRDEYFSARWTGQIEAPEDATYTFYTTTDDGVRLWINDELVIDNWTNHGPTLDTATKTFDLAQGQRVNFQMDYFEGVVGAVAQLQWNTSVSSEPIVIPNEAFYTKFESMNEPPVTTDSIRVLSIDYFGTSNNPTNPQENPDYKRQILIDAIEKGSQPNGNQDQQVDVEIIQKVERFIPLPGADGNISTWIPSYQEIMRQDNLCQIVEDRNIDQVWIFTDSISDSDLILRSDITDTNLVTSTVQHYSSIGNWNICETSNTISYLGFYYDYDSWHHLDTFTSLVRKTLSLVNGSAFYSSFMGTHEDGGAQVSYTKCGNPLFNFDVTENWNSGCHNWEPNNTWEPISINCSIWNCDRLQRMIWWLQQFPAKNEDITVSVLTGKYSFWWDYFTGFDEAIAKYGNNDEYHFNDYIITGTPPEIDTNYEKGLVAEYYQGTNFDTFIGKQIDPNIDNNWGQSAPRPDMDAELFSVRWSGQLVFPNTKAFELVTESDDGVRVWYNDELVIDNWTDHGPSIDTSKTLWYFPGDASKNLSNIKVEYYERYVGSTIKLMTKIGNSEPEIIKPENLLHDINKKEDPVPTPNPTTEPTPNPETEHGLKGGYTYDQNFDTFEIWRIDPQIDFSWDSDGPLPQKDYFYVRWFGQIEAPDTGYYKLITNSDDGVRVYLNLGDQVIDNWTDHGPTLDYSRPLYFEAGQRIDIQMDYYEKTGGAVIELMWQKPDGTTEVIPSENLYPTYDSFLDDDFTGPGLPADAGLKGEYYEGINFEELKNTRVDETVDFHWSYGSPISEVGSETFSVRWTGQIEIPQTTQYTFYTTSDDGVRLKLDNSVLIDNWTDHGPAEDSKQVTLAKGVYPITLEYYEKYVGSIIKLEWEYVDTNTGQTTRQVIPAEYFSHLPD